MVLTDERSFRAQPRVIPRQAHARATPHQVRGNLSELAATFKRLPQSLARLRTDGLFLILAQTFRNDAPPLRGITSPAIQHV